MRPASAARLATLALAAATLLSCGSPANFACTRDAECDVDPGGVCAWTGYCAYPSPACPSGLQYSPNAGVFSNRCVEGPPEAGTPDGGDGGDGGSGEGGVGAGDGGGNGSS